MPFKTNSLLLWDLDNTINQVSNIKHLFQRTFRITIQAKIVRFYHKDSDINKYYCNS